MSFSASPSDPPYRTSSPPAMEEEVTQEEGKLDELEEPSYPIGWVGLIVAAVELGVFFFYPLKETIVVSSVANLVAFGTYKLLQYQKKYKEWTQKKNGREEEKVKKNAFNLKAVCNTLVYESKNDLEARLRRANSHVTDDTAKEIANWVRVNKS